MFKNILARKRRALKSRGKIKSLHADRLSIHRTPRHIYAQVIDINGRVIASASTLDKDIKSAAKYTGNTEAAAIVGKLIGERTKQAGIIKVAFDRSGFKYHGRVKALADAAREAGIEF